MTKKPRLDSERVRSELSESAFFRRPEVESPVITETARTAQTTPAGDRAEFEPPQPIQTFTRAFVQTNGRAVVRASFDIFQDQQQALAEIQTARFKRTGRKPKMGELAQEAFDLYIRAMNEQANE
jgi:hypothetical protein